jgi:transglutaminase-like putative cysteine protease/Flp pilus assembly protein TadD
VQPIHAPESARPSKRGRVPWSASLALLLSLLLAPSPRDAQAAPHDAQTAPSETQAAPREAQAAPRETQAAPRETQAAPSNPYDADNRELAARAAREGARPEGLLPLLQLWNRWDDATPERTLALLERLAADRRLSPARKVMADRLVALGRARLGKRELDEAPFDALGYVTRWHVIGPFDNEGKIGFDQETPPEAKRMQAPDLEASYPGRERPVSWREFPDIAHAGYVSLGAITRPRQNVCGLAETFVHSERKQPLSLWLGAGGAVKVYWNGEPVFRDDAYRMPFPDRSAVMVGAHAGINRLLVKVCVTSSSWGFFLRLGNARGGVARGLRVESLSEKALDVVPGHGVRPPRGPTPALAALEQRAARKRPSARDLALLARLLHETGADDPAERRAKQLSARAAELQADLTNLRLAAAYAEERSEVMRFAQRAAEVAPEAPGSLLLRAATAADGLTPEDALPLLDRIPEGSLQWPSAQLLRARLLRDLGLPAAAASVVRDMVGEVGRTVRALGTLAELEHQRGNTDGSLALRREVLGLRQDDGASRRVLIQDALNRGDTPAVLEHLGRLTRLSPGSAQTYHYVAEIYDALGRDDMALATYRHAMKVIPESAELRVAYGRALLRADQPELAADALFSALALKPQDAATRELLEQIKPRPRLDEAYAESSDVILARRRPDEAYPSTVLTQITVNTVYENGLGSSFQQFAAQIHDDEGARRYRTYSIQYDPDTQRVDLRLARVYRKDGRVLESVRTFEQQLGEPWYRIYYDTRALVVVFPDLEPDDVIELRYRIDDVAHRNLFADYYGDLHTFQGFTPVAHSEYVLITPTERQFHMNQPDLEGLSHTREQKGERRIDHYVVDDVPAIVAEAGMPGLSEISPYLHVSTYETWQAVGRWYWGLIKDQLYADEDLSRTVNGLVKDADTTRDKVERIHNWVIENTRYVGLEFGIHGFMPYRVPLIVQRGFGDCKDKASLMYTMFREAGIDARIVLVRTRRNGDIAGQPASLSVFDHAIAYVPELDLFLDGTAEHSGTTELPVQDQGVTVLVVGPDGAELRKTPVLDAERNKRTRMLVVDLAPDGSARISAEETVTGAEAAGYRGYYEAPGTRAERFERSLASIYPGIELKQQRFEQLDDLEKPVRYSYRAHVPQLANRDGDELRVAPSVLHDLVRSMARLPERRHPLDLQGNRAYVEERTVKPPAGMIAAELPAGGEVRSPFGHLQLSFEREGDAVRARTEFAVTQDRVSPEQYPAFRAWVEQADRLLRQRVGIRKDEH